MPEKPVPLTREGLAKLEQELEYLRNVRRPEVAARIHAAKDLASTQDNAEYEDAKNEQAFVEGRVLTLEKLIQNAVLINEEQAHGARIIQLGSHVTVATQEGREENYVIVGPAEADPRDGRISNASPVGRALLGKRVGEKVQVSVPKGVIKLTVKHVS